MPMCALRADQWIIYTVKMNRFLTALLCLTAAVFTACSGTVDPEDADDAVVHLECDAEKLFADGTSAVTFTVLNGKEDVTSEAVIRCVTTGETLSGSRFSTTAEAKYIFNASYKGNVSNNVQVTAMFASQFERKVCVMEFTGQWCAQCPDGTRILNFLANDLYKGSIMTLAFHNDDEYSLPVERKLAAHFSVSFYPWYVTDMRTGGELKGNGCSDSVYESLYETETFCGPSVSCVYDAETGEVAVSADVASEKTMEYRLAAYVVEDKVVGMQTLATGSLQNDYNHRHVVRRMLSADFAGDRLGVIEAGKVAGKTYSFTLDPSWNPQNVTVAVLAIGPDGQVNNVASEKIIK